MPQYDDLQRSRNRSSNEKVRKRSNKLNDGGMPQYNSAKGGMSRYDDSQGSRNGSSSEKIYKRSDELKDGGMPQYKIITNRKHRMSPYKTLWDMLNDDVMKNIYKALMNECLNKTKHHRNYADKAKLK